MEWLFLTFLAETKALVELPFSCNSHVYPRGLLEFVSNYNLMILNFHPRGLLTFVKLKNNLPNVVGNETRLRDCLKSTYHF